MIAGADDEINGVLEDGRLAAIRSDLMPPLIEPAVSFEQRVVPV